MSKVALSTLIKRLFPPVDLDGLDEAAELAGSVLGDCDDAVDQLKKEMYPDTAQLTISDWERYLGLTTNTSLPLVTRQRNCFIKFYGRSLNKSFFIFLGQLLGHTDIEISDYRLNGPRCGISRAGDILSVTGLQWVWYVKQLDPALETGVCRCGSTYCGDRLGGDSFSIETLFAELKPAHTLVYFAYKAS